MNTDPEQYPEGVGRKEVGRILERHRLVSEQRLQRIEQALGHDQRRFFHLLPLLLHINHRNLPGYRDDSVPAGIAGYIPDRDAILHARHYARTLKESHRPPPFMPILGFYLIGSSGTLGQDRHSDFDFWVCHHPELGPEQLQALQAKLDLLHEHARELGLHCHFFLLHAQGFREGQHAALSNESSGDTQHHLLLEEFYRSGLLIAGHPPLWWLVPPHQVANYTAYCHRLVQQRFINGNDWLDFGGLVEIGAREFFSAAHWQLYKGIEMPYKALLKLVLFEAYAAEYPDIRWLSLESKSLIHADQPLDADSVDAYLLMMRHIEQHLQRQGEPERLDLVRRAFYFKSGVRLSNGLEDDWRRIGMRRITADWGWDRGELLNLDSHQHWKLPRVCEERNLLVAELSRSYRLLTDFARRHATDDSLHSSDLALLGRKLYAALERRPGKIDSVNPGISRDLSEETVWLRHAGQSDTWQLLLEEPQASTPAFKSTRSLTEMLVWLQVNRVIGRHTRIDLVNPPGPMADEHLRLLKLIRRLLPQQDHEPVPLDNFNNAAQGQLSVAFVNVMSQLPQDADEALRVGAHSDPLNFAFPPRTLVRAIDHLQGNNWGELQVDRYDDESALLDTLCAHLDLFCEAQTVVELRCHCHTPGVGLTILKRIERLASAMLAHFREHDEDARYILALTGELHLVERRRQQFAHRALGQQRELLEYLAEPSERFRASALDQAAMPDSPLAFVLQHSRPGSVLVCFREQRGGISLFVVDHTGALHQQWLPGAEEPHLLVQLQRFFNTLQTWNQVLPPPTADSSAVVRFLRLKGAAGQWRSETVQPPQVDMAHTELILSTGRRGPWKDGFSLISGSREFNSLQLGQQLYREVVDYVLHLRRGNTSYPLYLTGAVVTDDPARSAISLVELLGFKRLVEKRLAEAIQSKI